MELDNSPTLVTDTNPVEAPTVEAAAQAAPVSEAPRLTPDEHYAAHLADIEKASAKPAELTPTEKAPVSATVVAPEPNTAATPTVTEPVLTTEEKLAKAEQTIQQFEQARQVDEVRKLNQQQQADLASDKALLDKTSVALDRKITLCNSILQEIATARAEGDYEAVEELNAKYAEAYDDAQVLEGSKTRYEKEYQAKANYFKTQYEKTRESDNHRALEQIMKPYGLDAKAVIEKVPAEYRNNLLAVMDTALKAQAVVKDARIAELEQQAKDADEKANEKYRAKWDNGNPASQPHKNSGNGNSGAARYSKDLPPEYHWEQYEKERTARSRT